MKNKYRAQNLHVTLVDSSEALPETAAALCVSRQADSLHWCPNEGGAETSFFLFLISELQLHLKASPPDMPSTFRNVGMLQSEACREKLIRHANTHACTHLFPHSNSMNHCRNLTARQRQSKSRLHCCISPQL